MNELKRLKLSRCYMAGPMDAVHDRGSDWRDNLTPFLENLGIIVFNPCKKPIKDQIGKEDVDFATKRKILLENEDYEGVTNLMKPVRRIDLRAVDHSDFVILNLDLQYTICGSYEENAWANLERKPIIIHCPQKKKKIPPWLFAMLPHQLFFSTWDEVKSYLLHIHNDEKIETYNRWHFFDLEEPTRRALCV